MKLYTHQKNALKWLSIRPKALLCLDAGLGKTATSINTFKKNERILIICPATLKLNWEREIKMWMQNPPKIKVMKKKTDTLLKEGITIINFDILGSRKNKKIVPNFNFSGFDRVIVDEFHMIKNQTAIRTKITAKIIKNTPNAILLSGTPGEKSAHLYVPLYSIGATKMKWTSFGARFCDPTKIFIRGKEIIQYNGSSNTDDLRKIMEPFTLIMKKEDVLDLPDKIISVVTLDLPIDKREKNYNLNEILEDKRPLGFEGLSELLHDQGLRKIPLSLQHIKMRLESNNKIFIIAKHHDVIDLLRQGLKEFNPIVLDGRMSLKDKQNAVDRFQNDKNCRVFIGQITAAGVGITLTQASHAIFVENNWSFSDLSQCIDRLHRIGQKNTVTAEILTIANSIDNKILFKTLIKEKFTRDVLY